MQQPAESTAPYSPILDETVALVGISNKGHRKTVNVIQVLFIRETGNMMA